MFRSRLHEGGAPLPAGSTCIYRAKARRGDHGPGQRALDPGLGRIKAIDILSLLRIVQGFYASTI